MKASEGVEGSKGADEVGSGGGRAGEALTAILEETRVDETGVATIGAR
jgi:hypothetical protein